MLQSPTGVKPRAQTCNEGKQPNSNHDVQTPEYPAQTLRAVSLPVDQNSSCMPCHVQTPKSSPVDPNSQSCSGHATSIDVNKENVSPHILDSNGYPITVQGRSSTLTPPVPASFALPNQLDSIIPVSLPPIQTLLFMTLRGQSICFDLRTLDDDPRSIIELLSIASSDRDKWMVVGAFYRRKGNIHAALTVVTTMVKVLKDLGLRECDMKPAFLMLSSCHVELWRQTRAVDGSETETSAAHLDKSCRWLQLVYGQGNSEPMSESSSEVLETLPLVDTTGHVHSVSSTQELITLDRRQRTDIERDLQVLRDRQALHAEELAHTRESKRRLEDQAANERVIRRRLEWTLRDLETQLAKARRRADDAHALVRMEAITRRRCEQTIAEERAKRKSLEEHFKKQAQSARPLLEGLAALFERAGMQVKNDAFVSSASGGTLRR